MSSLFVAPVLTGHSSRLENGAQADVPAATAWKYKQKHSVSTIQKVITQLNKGISRSKLGKKKTTVYKVRT